MKKKTAQWVRKAEADLGGARTLARTRPPFRDLACFHCQQSAEKYLKALLQELGLSIPRIHDLEELLGRVLTHDASLSKLERAALSLNQYAVDYRYPDAFATTRQMNAALRSATRVRDAIRGKLGLSL